MFIRFQPGDVCYILPENPIDEVEKFLSLAFPTVNPSQTLISSIKPKEINVQGSNPLKSLGLVLPLTLRDLCVHYLNILGTPRKYFFELLSHFATDDREKERLEYFGSKEGSVRCPLGKSIKCSFIY